MGLKRVFDVIIAGALLLVAWPLMLAIAVAIKLDSFGPAFFCSTRVGKDGRPFRMYKFRTMVQDAEALLPKLQHLNRGGQLSIKIPNDPRITRVGRFLRKSSLDELPQLVNVLKGDMSLVGPRPQYPREAALYSEQQRRRLAVLPGITGLWQVSARDSADFNDWVRYDLTYIDNWSMRLDVQIIVRTIGAIFKATGA